MGRRRLGMSDAARCPHGMTAKEYGLFYCDNSRRVKVTGGSCRKAADILNLSHAALTVFQQCDETLRNGLSPNDPQYAEVCEVKSKALATFQRKAHAAQPVASM